MNLGICVNLKRNIRDREERESSEKERLTEEEKRKEALLNPVIIIALAMNGKYKFLRKYYPDGAFYWDKNEDTIQLPIT